MRLNHEFHRADQRGRRLAEADAVHVGHHAVRAGIGVPDAGGLARAVDQGPPRVIAAFERRDADQARTAMAEHFTVGVAPLTEHLTERGVIVIAEPAAETHLTVRQYSLTCVKSAGSVPTRETERQSPAYRGHRCRYQRIDRGQDAQGLRRPATPRSRPPTASAATGRSAIPNGHSSAYRSLHIDTSRDTVVLQGLPDARALSDVPAPRRYQGVPRRVRRHVRTSRPHRVRQRRRQRPARRRRRLDDHRPARCDKREFDLLVVANGHHWDARLPDFPGTFNGLSIHSHHYIDPQTRWH